MAMSPRLLRPRATGFSPNSLSGLAAWWDANNTSSLTLDANGNVSTWADLSGNGANATQTISNNRPTPTVGGLNGKRVLTFDGSNDVLTFSGTSRTDETLIAVAFANLPSAGNVKPNNIITAANGAGISVTVKNDGGTNGVVAYLGGFSAGVTISFNLPGSVAFGPSIVTVTRSSATGGVLFTNGTQRGTCVSSNAMAIDRLGSAMAGYLAECLIYSRPVSATERQRVEKYLASKWGITIA